MRSAGADKKRAGAMHGHQQIKDNSLMQIMLE